MIYFITGGTGTIGKVLVGNLLANKLTTKVIVFSRDEYKQSEMMKKFPENSRTRYFIGDICDKIRLCMAMNNSVDVVIHTAAMKRIDSCEYNPSESIRVNINGSLNVATACNKTRVKHAVFLSTDKACNPVSAYGAQKYTVERMWIGMNNMTPDTKYNVVRYGNVIGSRGSVFQYWQSLKDRGEDVTLTNKDMTRFFWSIQNAADFILRRINDAWQNNDRGCIYVPKMDRSKMWEMAKQFSTNIKITGFRCPEKIDEELISSFEGMCTHEFGDHYIIYPKFHEWTGNIVRRGKKVKSGFTYTSSLK